MTSNKDRALEACRLLSERDLDTLFADFDEEGTWTMPFLPARFSFAGKRGKTAMRELLEQFLGGFDSFEFAVEQAVAEGDTVAIQGSSRGGGPGKALYQNTYHLLFTFREGRVLAVRELFDPYQVEAYLEQIETQSA